LDFISALVNRSRTQDLPSQKTEMRDLRVGKYLSLFLLKKYRLVYRARSFDNFYQTAEKPFQKKSDNRPLNKHQ